MNKIFLIPLAVLAFAGCSTSQTADTTSAAELGPNTVSLKVDGMACPNGAKHIAEELKEVPGVTDATVNFNTKTAIVKLDLTNPATTDSLNAAVAKWKKEHFSQEEDPDCLDPAKRKELMQAN